MRVIKVFKTLLADRPTIERKYHNPDEPFDAYSIFNYSGYECDKLTGLSNTEIKENMPALAKKYKDLPHPVAKALYVKYVLENTQIDINESDYFITLHACTRIGNKAFKIDWYNEILDEKPEIRQILKDFNDSGTVAIWPDFDHVVPDFNSLLHLGFSGIRERARKYKAQHKQNGTLTEEKRVFFEGIEI